MKYKLIYLTFIVLSIGAQTYAQSNQDKALGAYYKAQEQFDAGDYQACINKLNESVQLLGTNKPNIEYYMAKAYNGLENYKQVKIELQKYFALNPKADDWYKEMLALSDEVDAKIKAQQEKELQIKKQKEEAENRIKQDNEAWQEAFSIKTALAYELYLARFPSGINSKTATAFLEDIYWLKAQEENTLAAYDNFLNKFPQSYYRSRVAEKKEPLLLEERMRNNPDYYFDLELEKEKEGKADPYLIWKLLGYGVSYPCKSINVHVVDIGEYRKDYIISAMAIGARLNSTTEAKKYLALLFEKGNRNCVGNYQYSNEFRKLDCMFRETIMLYVSKFKEDEAGLLEIVKLVIAASGHTTFYDSGLLLSQLTKDHSLSKKNAPGIIDNTAIIEFLLQKGSDPKEKENCNNTRTGESEGWESAYKLAKEGNKYDLITLFDKYNR